MNLHVISSNTMRIHLITLLITIGLLAGCNDSVPTSGPTYDVLHGINNNGKTVNEITLDNYTNNNHPKLKFRPEIYVEVDTPESHSLTNPRSIRKGFAYRAHITLNFTDDKLLAATSGLPKNKILGSVDIWFFASLGPELVVINQKRLREIELSSIQTSIKKDWKLREYTPVIGGVFQGFEYVPINDGFKSIDGVRMYFGCGGTGSIQTKNFQIHSCSSHFNYPGGISVTYGFQPELLPYWSDIYREVVSVTDSVLVK